MLSSFIYIILSSIILFKLFILRTSTITHISRQYTVHSTVTCFNSFKTTCDYSLMYYKVEYKNID